MDYAAIAAIIASVIGSLVGAGEDAKAQALRQQVLEQYGPEMLPHLDRAVAQEVQGTAFGNLQEDDSLRSKQLETLGKLSNEYDTGGMTAADRGANQLAFGDAAARTESTTRGITNSMAQRGQSGGPADFALQQQAAQDSTNQAANMARSNASDARMRALQALEASGSMAGNIRTADYRKLSDLAQAQDEMNQFNSVQRTNAQTYNNNLPQQQFDNNMLMLNAKANASNGVAAGYERGGQAARDTAGGVGQGLITWGTKKKKDGE